MYGRFDIGVGVAEQTGGELADEIGVAVAVQVDQFCALAGGHGQRERLVIQHVAGVAAGHVPFRLLVGVAALGVGVGVTVTGIFDRLV